MTEKKKPGLPAELQDILARAMGGMAMGAMGQNPDPLPVEEPEDEEEALELSPQEILEECAREPETDIGNARRFLARYGDEVMHVTHVGWHGYKAGRWLEDASGSVVRQLAHRTAEFIDEEAILLDCDHDEQAGIEAGRHAMAKMREMGKPPSAKDAIDEDRLAELDTLIDDMHAAEKEKVQIGNPKADWPDETHEMLRKVKDRIKTGRQAEREKRKMLDATSSWTADDYAAYAELEKQVAAMDAVQEARSGRMSARHTFAKSSAGTNRINNMLNEAIPYVSKDVGDLNRDLFAVNCINGTLRFRQVERDGRRDWIVSLDRHRSSDFISKLAEVPLKREAGAPLFDKFLQKVMPKIEYRAFLQRFMGYCLLGLTVEQCLLFFYGAGRNGKSTFVDLMVDILGDYAVSMSIDSFAGDSRRAGAEATPDLARLPGARLVAASEPEMGVKLKDALIKTLTGGEVIAVRRLHQDFFELVPQFKIILSGNHKPVIQDDSDGIWRRVHLVPWDIQIAEEEVDRDLPRKLRAERDGIFAWMVAGALEYLKGGLKVPEGIRAATAEYREESDPIGAFIRGGCEVTGKDDDKANPGDLFAAYTLFAKRHALSEFKQATFSKRLPDQTRKTWEGPDRHMHQFRKGKAGTTVYYGIRVKPEYLPQHDRHPVGAYAGSDEPWPEDFP